MPSGRKRLELPSDEEKEELTLRNERIVNVCSAKKKFEQYQSKTRLKRSARRREVWGERRMNEGVRDSVNLEDVKGALGRSAHAPPTQPPLTPRTHNERQEIWPRLTYFPPLIIRRHIGSLQEERR